MAGGSVIASGREPDKSDVFVNEFLGEVYEDRESCLNAIQKELQRWEWLKEFNEEKIEKDLGIDKNVLSGESNLFELITRNIEPYNDYVQKGDKTIKGVYVYNTNKLFQSNFTNSQNRFGKYILECSKNNKNLAAFLWIALTREYDYLLGRNAHPKIVEDPSIDIILWQSLKLINNIKITSKTTLESEQEQFRTAANSAVDKLNKEHENQQKKFNELSRAYEQQLTLQKPSEYWNKRKSNCKNAAFGGIVAFVFVFILSIGTLIALYYSLEISDKKTFHLGKGVIFTSATVILMYILTQITKFIMGNYHSSYEADEKIVMIESYISLYGKEQISSEERKFVFENIFKLSDSGFIKSSESSSGSSLIQNFPKLS